jgi:CHAT domain-containing protein/tetratricopeptide (TPR) repeat protein
MRAMSTLSLPTRLARLSFLVVALALGPGFSPGFSIDGFESAVSAIELAMEKGDRSNAATLLRRAVGELERDGSLDAGTRLERSRKLGGLALELDCHPEDLRLRKTIVELLAGASRLELLAAQADLGRAHAAVDELDQGRKLLEEVLAAELGLLERENEELLETRHSLGTTLHRLDLFEGASTHLEDVLAVRVGILAADDQILLTTKRDVAAVRRALGDLEGARLLLADVVAAREGQGASEDPAAVQARAELAGTEAQLGNLSRARELFEQLPRPAGASPGDSSVDDGLLAEIGRVQRAIDEAQEVEALAGAGMRHERLLEVFGDLKPPDAGPGPTLPAPTGVFPDVPGFPNPGQGFPPGAPGLPELPSHRQQPDPAKPDRLGGLLSGSLPQMPTPGQDGEQFIKDLELGLEGPSPDLAEMEEKFRRLQSTLTSSQLFDAHLKLARKHLASSNPAPAIAHLDELLATSDRRPDDPELVAAKRELALTKRDLGKPEGARTLLREVLQAEKQLFPREHPRLHETREALAWVEIELRGPALEVVVELLDGMRARIRSVSCLAPRVARESARAELRRLGAAVSLLVALEGSVGRQAALERDVFAVLETLRALSTSLPPTGDPAELRQLQNRAARLRAELADLCQPSAELGSEGWRERVHALDEDLREAEEELRARTPGIQGLLDEIGASGASQRLAEGEAVLTFFRYARTSAERTVEQRMLAFVLRRDGRLSRIDLGASAELERLVSAWRGSIIKQGERGISLASGQHPPEPVDPGPSGRALRAAVLDPLLGALEGAQRVHVCLDDVLFLVPLDALPLEEEGVLGDRLRLLHLSSLAQLLAPETPGSSERVLALAGGIDYEATTEEARATSQAVTPPLGASDRLTLKPLEGTRTEVQALARLFEARTGRVPRLLTGQSVTRSALRAALEGATHVHLATHGWFAGDDERSQGDDAPLVAGGMRGADIVRGFAPLALCGLGLSGANLPPDELGRVEGILTAEELAGFPLAACELAVLSACETNVGLRRAGQGIQSLQTALHEAGARSSLTSLWSVSDDSTVLLMEAFYHGLWEQGLSKSEALWRAKRSLRERGLAPWHWAGWVLTGDAS